MKKGFTVLLTFAILFGSCFAAYRTIHDLWREFGYGLIDHTRGEMLVHAYAEANDLRYTDYPEELIALLDRNPETSAYVLEYPFRRGKTEHYNITEYKDSESVPLFMQWDQRWGYMTYGDGPAGLTACGPICLSMVGYYLTEDPKFAPEQIMEFSMDNGYCIPGNGTAWTLISEGAVRLGLEVTELPLHDNTIISNLEAGWPIICIMGPGDFTSTGHYIVLTGYENGAFRVNDPNSYKNSEQLWTYEQIESQIRNLWVLKAYGT